MFSETVQVALIAIIPSTLIALGSLIASVVNGIRLSGIHKQINSRMDQLIATVSDAQRAEGKLEGVKQQKDEGKLDLRDLRKGD